MSFNSLSVILTPNGLISLGSQTSLIETTNDTSLGNPGRIGEVRPTFAHTPRPANQDDAATGDVNESNIGGTQHPCPDASCGRSFATAQGLGQHRRRVHMEAVMAERTSQYEQRKGVVWTGEELRVLVNRHLKMTQREPGIRKSELDRVTRELFPGRTEDATRYVRTKNLTYLRLWDELGRREDLEHELNRNWRDRWQHRLSQKRNGKRKRR